MNEVTASKVNFIKLGRKGQWEKECIEHSHTLRLGFSKTDHSLCLAKEWEAIREYFVTKESRTSIVATGFANQIKEFYEATDTVLWITFYKRVLWWCFSDCGITLLDDKSKTRPVIGQWKCESITGNPLDVDHLSGKLLRVQGFRGTIYRVIEADYVLKKINGQEQVVTTEARNALVHLSETLRKLIQQLHWKDFETLVDLIFRQAGWQRIGVVGKTEKHIDIELLSPVLAHRAFVQIKSASDVQEFEQYCEAFGDMPQFQQMFYVVHTPNPALSQSASLNPKIKLLMLDDISKLTVSGGLAEWLIEKTS